MKMYYIHVHLFVAENYFENVKKKKQVSMYWGKIYQYHLFAMKMCYIHVHLFVVENQFEYVKKIKFRYTGERYCTPRIQACFFIIYFLY